MKRTLLLVLIICLASIPCVSQETLTNQSVLKMVKAGLGDELIVNIIKTQPAKFSLTTDDIIALKQAGVSDKVLSAMVDKSAPAPSPAAAPATPPAPEPAAPAPATTAPAPAATVVPADGAEAAPVQPPAAASPVREVGVYYKKGDKWEPLVPELVAWKSGGVLKTIVRRGEMTGRVDGVRSRASLVMPLEILIYAPADTAANTYELFRLREEDGAREFRAGGKASKDAVAVEAKKIAPRTFQATVMELPPGEYGVLAPTPPAPPTSDKPPSAPGTQTAVQSKDAPAHPQLGKLYTFRIGD